MNYKLPQYIIVPFAVFFGVALLGIFISFFHSSDSRAAQADTFYRSGEEAQTIADRKKAFNEALGDYMQLETEYKPRFGNGKLYYNLGNTYFQLGEYPWAIFYYMKAQALMPRSKSVETNLALAKSKLSLPDSDLSSLNFLSLPERLQLFAALAVIALLLLSAWIWMDNHWFKNSAFVVLALAGLVLLSLAYTRYLAPLEGVFIQASDVYRDAGKQYAKVGEEPVSAGSTVEVLGKDPSGKWFKILTPKGAMGYVSQEALRVVDS